MNSQRWRQRWRVTTALVGVLLLATATEAQNFGAVGWEKFFTLDWEAAAHRGRSVVRGYVVNEYGAPAARIQLLVEGVNGAGAVVATTMAHVFSEVQPGGRAYFEVPAPGPSGAYRVRVLSWERIEAGGDRQ